MKKIALVVAALLAIIDASAQITVTAADMPVAGDTLRYSFASPVGSTFSPADSGAGFTWNYALTPIRQAVDTYQTALSVNFLYVATVGPTAYGYKVADSFPGLGGLLPVSIQKLYTFFEKKTSPSSRYQAQAFAANISGLPTAISYSPPDVWYFFPLDYSLHRTDSSQYKLNITLPTLGGIKQGGYRKSTVDGWGTITTPYYPTPVNCIRVRSEIHEVDSISISPLPSIGFPRNSVEYKWLVNGDHYPALWITTTLTPGGGETVSNIRYRDTFRDTTKVNQVVDVTPEITTLKAVPNPSSDGIFSLEIPAGWQSYTVEVYDMQSREVAHFNNQNQLDLHLVPQGNYVGRVTSGTKTAYVRIVR